MDVVDDTIAALTSADAPSRGSAIRAGSIIGRYLVISRLGAGGMGMVFSAYDPELDRKLALKLVRADRRGNTENAALRLQREAQAMAKLHHPNVLTVHDVGIHEGAVFIAMEFVQGKTLREWLKESRRSLDEVLPLFRQLARGLGAAHAIGLVHRDVKPDNILVGDDGRVRVMDFGLVRAQRSLHEGVPDLSDVRALEPEARTEAQVAGDAMARVRDRLEGLGKLSSATPSDQDTLDATSAEDRSGGAAPKVEARDALDGSLTRSGALLGTPAYMAPEQVADQELDGRADQFSLCVCLYEAVYGERPFQGSTLQELVGNLVRGTLAEPAKRVRIPGFADRAIRRGLSRRPQDRFPDMKAFEDALVVPRVGRMVGGAAGVSLLAAVGVWALQTPPVCTVAEADEAMGGAWDAQAQSRLSAAWSQTNLPYAEASLAAVADTLDDYAEQWRGSWTTACAATRVDHVQSEALLDRRMACLETRRSAVAGLVEVLGAPTAGDVENAVAAAASLPAVSRCDDTEALLASVEPPTDATLAKGVVELEGELAQVATLRTLGHYDDAFESGRRLRERAESLAYEPTLAHVDLELGRIDERRGDYSQAAAKFRSAARRARANRDDETAAAAETELVFTVGYRLGERAEGQWWADQASAAVQGLRSGGALRARLTNYEGVALFAGGRPAEGLVRLERAVDEYTAALGPSDPETLEVKFNVGLALRRTQRFAEAEQLQREVLTARERILGSEHPEVGKSVHEVANALMQQHDVAAGPLYDRALKIVAVSVGPEHPQTAAVLLGRGAFLEDIAGDRAAARADFTRALGIFTEHLGPDHTKTAEARWNLTRLDARGETAAPEPSASE